MYFTGYFIKEVIFEGPTDQKCWVEIFFCLWDRQKQGIHIKNQKNKCIN